MWAAAGAAFDPKYDDWTFANLTPGLLLDEYTVLEVNYT